MTRAPPLRNVYSRIIHTQARAIDSGRNRPLLLPPPGLTINILLRLLLIFFLFLLPVLIIRPVLTRIHPAVPVHGLILARQIDARFGLSPCLPPLAQRPRARAQIALYGGILAHPVREGVFAVLDDGLGGLVAVVRVPRLAGGDGRVVDELEEVLAEARDDGELLAVLAQRVELVVEGGFELLARDVGQLGFGDEGLGFGADELLFEDDDLGGLRLFVFELGDLVGDFLFPWKYPLASLSGKWAREGNLRSRDGWTLASMFRTLFNVTRY